MPMSPKPSQARLREVFHYQSETGDLVWAVNRGGYAGKGIRAGNDREDGYVRIKIDRRLHMAHALIWIYHYGDIPDEYEVDHKDGNPSNNRLANLRLATRTQNMRNVKTPKHSTSGCKGVHQRAESGKWRAYITIGKRRIWLGSFDTYEEAKAVRHAAAAQGYGEFARNE